jgi:hypothetical protein
MDSLVSDYTLQPTISDRETISPDPERVKDAFARIGYSLAESIADLIDNSIDAKATDVLVRFLYDRGAVRRVFVVDNGHGMKEEVLRRAMRFGSTLKHEKSDLGKYGIGFKSASLNQCEQFSVISRSYGETSGRRWSAESFKTDWLCEKLHKEDCALLLGARWAGLTLKQSGTIVVWDKLTCLQTGDLSPTETVNDAITELAKHLGLVFHRFISKNYLRIHLDSQPISKREAAFTQIVKPLDPFGYSSTGAKNYPKKFHIKLETAGDLTLTAHIWPRKSRDPGYVLGGGKVSSRQGFYFYRNNRLIQAGGWNGFRHDDAEPHLSLARVSIDLPLTAEGHFDVTVQKSKVAVPRDFVGALQNALSDSVKFSEYVTKAIEVYRKRSLEQDDDFPLVPWGGLPAHTHKSTQEILAPDDSRIRKVSFVWTNKLDAGTVFDVDRENLKILLNELHRKSILKGARRSKTDAAMFKAMVFLLIKEYLDLSVMTRRRKEFLDNCNRLLLRLINE